MIIAKTLDNLLFKLLCLDVSQSTLISHTDRLTPSQDLPVTAQLIRSIYGRTRLERSVQNYDRFSELDGYTSDITCIFTIPFIYDCASSLIKDAPANSLTFKMFVTILSDILNDFYESFSTTPKREEAFGVNKETIEYVLELLRSTVSSNFDNIARRLVDDIVN